ncbi:hypothetical protein PQR15_35380 [Streptomyces lydicus]|nr:hypothetical protein [Streptomyces lydicus]
MHGRGAGERADGPREVVAAAVGARRGEQEVVGVGVALEQDGERREQPVAEGGAGGGAQRVERGQRPGGQRHLVRPLGRAAGGQRSSGTGGPRRAPGAARGVERFRVQVAELALGRLGCRGVRGEAGAVGGQQVVQQEVDGPLVGDEAREREPQPERGVAGAVRGGAYQGPVFEVERPGRRVRGAGGFRTGVAGGLPQRWQVVGDRLHQRRALEAEAGAQCLVAVDHVVQCRPQRRRVRHAVEGEVQRQVVGGVVLGQFVGEVELLLQGRRGDRTGRTRSFRCSCPVRLMGAH